jgi:S-(hydroxymethyl)glutathione dehydrogenase/alcohol dehydrogenase
MRGAVLYAPQRPLQIEQFTLPDIAPDQVRVRLVASGVCHSDFHVIKGDWPHIPVPTILGHEGAGVVEEIGEQAGGQFGDLAVGDHVILSWKRNCGRCEMCQRGYPNLCDALPDPRGRPTRYGQHDPMNKMLGLGTFSTETIVPAELAIRIDPEVPLQQAALVGCGVMTGVGAVINTAQVRPGESVAVFGCGGVGLNCIQGAALAGAEPIIAVDVHDGKLELARAFGATHTVNARQDDPVEAIRSITGGPGVHYAFEAIGVTPEPFIQSVLCTRKRGVTVFVGHAPFNMPIALDTRLLMPEKMITGCMYGTSRPRVDFPRMISLYKAGRLKLDELVTQVYPLEQVNDAFTAMATGAVARSVLDLS